MRVNDGDGLTIAASGVKFVKNISGAAAGSGLGVLGSGLSLAQDIDGLDDAFASGDARTIAQATMNTAYDGISLYNSASAMAGFSQVGGSNMQQAA